MQGLRGEKGLKKREKPYLKVITFVLHFKFLTSHFIYSKSYAFHSHSLKRKSQCKLNYVKAVMFELKKHKKFQTSK